MLTNDRLTQDGKYYYPIIFLDELGFRLKDLKVGDHFLINQLLFPNKIFIFIHEYNVYQIRILIIIRFNKFLNHISLTQKLAYCALQDTKVVEEEIKWQ